MHPKVLLLLLFISTVGFCKKSKQMVSVKKIYLKNKKLVLKDSNFNYALPTVYYVDAQSCSTVPPWQPALAKEKNRIDSILKLPGRIKEVSCDCLKYWKATNEKAYRKCDSMETYNHLLNISIQQFKKKYFDSLHFIQPQSSLEETDSAKLIEFNLEKRIELELQQFKH